MFPPVGEHSLALELIQDAQCLKRLHEQIGVLDGKLCNAHISMDTVDGGCSLFPEVLKRTVHPLIRAENARMFRNIGFYQSLRSTSLQEVGVSVSSVRENVRRSNVVFSKKAV